MKHLLRLLIGLVALCVALALCVGGGLLASAILKPDDLLYIVAAVLLPFSYYIGKEILT